MRGNMKLFELENRVISCVFQSITITQNIGVSPASIWMSYNYYFCNIMVLDLWI